MCDDGFEGTTSYDWQKAYPEITVDGRRLGSLAIYHRHIHWPCGADH